MNFITLLALGCVLVTVCFAKYETIQFNSINKNEKCCKCTPVTPVGNFSLKQFSSTWYVIAKSKPSLSRNKKCISAKVSAINATQANYSSYEQNVWTNKPEVGETLMFRKYDNIPGILAIGPKDSKFTRFSNYTVVDVDYKNYAVVHVCTKIKFFSFESAYIISINPTLDKKTVDKGKQKLKSFGFNTDHFSAVDQLNCN